MKKYISICFIFMAALFVVSCEEENSDVLVGGDGSADLSANVFANIDPDPTFSFLYQVSTGVSIDLDEYVKDGLTIQSVTVTKVLNASVGVDGASVSSPVVTYSVTTGELNQTEAELFADVPVEGNILTEEDLSPGDTWQFKYTEIILSTGKVLTPNRASTLTFTCPSNLEGEYDNHTEVGFTDFGPQTYDLDATLVALGGGQYTVEDMTGGLWSTTYADAYGTSARATVLTDICGTLSIADAPDQFGGFITNEGQQTPNLDPGTGVISWGWIDTIYGEDGVTVYTPK